LCGKPCGDQCCAASETCCGDSCCPANFECIGDSCCPQSLVCDKVFPPECCHPPYPAVCTVDGCCHTSLGNVTCPDLFGNIRCCGRSDAWACTSDGCCPVERVCNKRCCPPGEGCTSHGCSRRVGSTPVQPS
jgi:hypothetical protein